MTLKIKICESHIIIVLEFKGKYVRLLQNVALVYYQQVFCYFLSEAHLLNFNVDSII